MREQPLHASQSGLAAMNTVEELQRLLQLAAEERSLTQQSIESLESENSQYRSKLEQCRDALQAKAGFEDSARKAMSALAAEKHA